MNNGTSGNGNLAGLDVNAPEVRAAIQKALGFTGRQMGDSEEAAQRRAALANNPNLSEGIKKFAMSIRFLDQSVKFD